MSNTTGYSGSYLEQFNFDMRGQESSPKLVFLHGLMGSWVNWRRFITSFEPNFQVLAFDQRGHGKSMRPDHGYAPEDYANDLKKILDGLGWDKIDLVGHSMGGRNAFVFASMYPDYVHKLVVEDIGPEGVPEQMHKIEQILERVPTPFTDKRVAKETILNSFRDQTLAQYLYSNIAEVKPGLFDWRFSKSGILESLHLGHSVSRWNEWRSLRIPTLLVRGEQSQELPQVMYEKMCQLNANVRGVVIANSGHWVHFDQPAAFESELRQFLV